MELHKPLEYDDINSALEYNHPLDLSIHQIDGIIAQVCGENDELNWHWIVKTNLEDKNKRYAYIWGGCDYTGWDCQSFADGKFARTLREVVNFAPEKEDYSNRNIRINLKRQISGKQPYALYQE